jgi:hypothetical protein
MSMFAGLLPSGVGGGRFDVLQLHSFVWYLGHLEASFAAALLITCYIKVRSDEVQSDGEFINLIVEVTIPGDLLQYSPISDVSSCIPEDLELISWSNEQVLEPCWDGECWDRVCVFIILKVGLGVEFSDVGVIVRPLSVGVAGDCAIIVEFDPFGWVIEVRANWDAEVGNVVGIDCVPGQRGVEGFLVVTYLLFQSVMLQQAYYLLL